MGFEPPKVECLQTVLPFFIEVSPGDPFLLRSLLEIQLIQLHDSWFIFKQFLTLVCHRCLLEFWPFISYNLLFLWDYTFYFNGVFLVLITGINRAITVDILSISPLPADQLRSLSPSDLGWMAPLRSLHGGVRRRLVREIIPFYGLNSG
jgi:hypothetical protein